MLRSVVDEYLRKCQKLQAEYAEKLNSFSVETRFDDYYGVYIYVTFSDDNGKYVANFIECYDKTDFEITFNQLINLLDNEKR